MWLYLASFAVLVVGQALYVFKWGLVVGAMGLPVPFPRLAEQYLLGIFFNNFLPTMIGGDAARVYYLGRQEGYATVATSIFVDRGLGFLSMAAWGSALVWWLNITTPAFIVARNVLTVLCVIMVAGLAAALTLRLAPIVALLRRAPLLARVADTLELVRKRGRPCGGSRASSWPSSWPRSCTSCHSDGSTKPFSGCRAGSTCPTRRSCSC